MGKIEVTAETWDLITAIEETIEAVLAREGEQVEQRKTQEQELNRLGALFADDGRGRSSLEKKLKEAGLADKQVQILLTRSDHVVTLRAIKELRARYDALNNKLREVVRDTNQGKLFPESKSDITALTKEPVESALFAEPPKAEVQDADQMQFGEDGQAQNGETRAKEDGYTPGEGEPREDPIAKTSIKDLELEPRIETALREARLTNIGKVEDYERGGAKHLEDVPGLGPSSAAAVRKAIKKHSRAALQSA